MVDKLILVTGATGYIASRLIPRLLERGYRVRCMVRRPYMPRGRAWFRKVEIVAGEVMDPASLAKALEGVWTAYYLVHNMASGHGYTGLELAGARNFAAAAEAAGVEHIIYLGGLADPKARIAAHMRSRIETGETLRAGPVPVTEFRAGVIAGPGSISFEMIRFMTELFPIVPGPAWMKNRSQPIAAQNVFDYLLAALENPAGRGRVFEIGGPDVMHYSELMLEYARLRGLKRRMITFPYIPLWFMSFGVGLTSPVPRRIAYALIDGLRSDSRVQEDSAQRIFPEVKLVRYEQAVRSALARLHPEYLEPVWRDSQEPAVHIRHEGFFISHRSLHVAAPPEKVFRVVSELGGEDDWLYANWLWRVRAWLDSFFQKRRASRRSGPVKEVGDTTGPYRVEAIEPERRLLLHSELKAPGEGWMEWRVEPEEDGRTRLTQTGFFAPRGLPGFLYWYVLYPGHELVFRGLIQAIGRKAEGRKATAKTPRTPKI
jgi:uncharacterized protein YbjT (DUF2867 family)/uncharacterized protein YndB with AHSA1/START domain